MPTADDFDDGRLELDPTLIDGDEDSDQDLDSEAIPAGRERRADTEGADDAATGEAEGQEDYGDRVQRRIGKEVRKRHEAERAVEIERQRAADLERQLTEALREREQLIQDRDERRKSELLSQKRSMELDDLAPGSEEAKQFDAIDDELTEIRMRQAQRKQSAPKPAEDPPERKPEPKDSRPQAMQDWFGANRHWYDPQSEEFNPRAQKLADEVFVTLRDEEGLNPGHENFYRELNKRLQGAGRNGNGHGNAAGPSRGFEGSSGRNGASGGLDGDDLQVMRENNLNPRDPKDRAKYLRWQGKGA